MRKVATGPIDGARVVELFGGVRKKKVYLYFSTGTTVKWRKFDDDDDGDDEYY